MQTCWTRETPIKPGADRLTERWTPPGPTAQSFTLDVRVGKPFDVMGIKGSDLTETVSYANFLAASVASLYGANSEIETVAACPACLADTASAPEAFRIFDIAYHRCSTCGHGFVRHRPTAAAFDRHFRKSTGHASAYVDQAAAERRIAEIVLPKLDWLLDIFATQVGGRPKRGIDVGAGGGHFVTAARRAGIDMTGWELAEESRRFAKTAFDIELKGEDYLKAPLEETDLITYWGLLEYVPAPRYFFEAARARLSPGKGLLVAEVPRLEAVSTLAQIDNPTQVARHMDPSSHINCFSDTSLFTALLETGFKPVAAWYFGMDAYELLTQAALRGGQHSLLDSCAAMIPLLQSGIDQGRICDDLVVAAVPV